MFNQIVIVGRIEELESDYSEDRLNGMIRIAVEREFPESNSEYLTDHFNVRVWRGMVETIRENYGNGDLIGINGRIQTEPDSGAPLIIAEKVSLIRRATKKECHVN
ncbi:MAG: single-stranded DNA-binding protein [Erysipelotrichaceae bacterium]|nr:single-stranded DNA-binding protein [Erysipelotrichaceae bacterium]